MLTVGSKTLPLDHLTFPNRYGILTAATKLFSVMKVTHRRGSVSELRLFTLWRHNRGQNALHTPTQIHRQVCCPTLLLRASLASLCHRHSGVMGRPGQAVTRVREAHTVHPATTSTQSLSCSRPSGLKQHLPKGHLAAPWCWSRLFLHLLNVG